MSSALRFVPTPEAEVNDLLALAMFPDPERIRATLTNYASDPQRQVWVWQLEGRPVCAAGVSVSGRAAEIFHLATRADARRQGHARRLVYALLDCLDLRTLEAEADEEEVEFYRQAGFKVEETEGRGGHVRFRCILFA